MAATCVLAACTAMDRQARDRFRQDHRGCRPTSVRERPDLLSPGQQPPNVAHSGFRAYEVTGCDSHDLEVCESGGYLPSGEFSPAVCSPMPMCAPAPSCVADDAAVARTRFVTEYSCPRERVATAPAAPVVPSPPPDVAADPARNEIWRQAHRDVVEQAQRLTWVKAQGCGAEAVYACRKQPPSLPSCVKTAVP